MVIKNDYNMPVLTSTERSAPFLPLSSFERSLDPFSIRRVTSFIWCYHRWAVTIVVVRLTTAL